MEKLKIALVEDHVMVRDGMKYMFADYASEIEVQLEASNGKELVEQLKKTNQFPDLVIMDIVMPILNGIETCKIMTKQFPEIKVIFLTAFAMEVYIEKAILVGARAYLTKDIDFEQVIGCIKQVKENGIFYNEHLTKERLFNGYRQRSKGIRNTEIELSEREIHFIGFVCREFSDKDIAEEMGITFYTATTYRKQIMRKIGVKKTSGIVMYANLHKLV